MSHMSNARTMPQAQFEALQTTLYRVAQAMSREQMIELADGLFDCSRARRELRRYSQTARHVD